MHWNMAVWTSREYLRRTIPFSCKDFKVIFGSMALLFQVCYWHFVIPQVPKLHASIKSSTDKHVFNLRVESYLTDPSTVAFILMHCFAACSCVPETDYAVFTSCKEEVALSCVNACGHLVLGKNTLLYNVTFFYVYKLYRMVLTSSNQGVCIKPRQRTNATVNLDNLSWFKIFLIIGLLFFESILLCISNCLLV